MCVVYAAQDDRRAPFFSCPAQPWRSRMVFLWASKENEQKNGSNLREK
jgi:hypothetical protein